MIARPSERPRASVPVRLVTSAARTTDLFARATDPDPIASDAPPAHEILVGTSGYSFPDWVGPFYPRGLPSREFLSHYAERFPCVEVNVTYYRMPEARHMARLLTQTPPGFRFAIKLHQSFTHGRTFEPTEAARFLDAIRPLVEAGRCIGLLAQFPWAFRRDEAAKSHLERLREAFPGTPLWIEFRHASWMHPRLASWLAERDLGYCAVDEPALPGLVPPVTHVTNGLGYVRFHGRNAAHWWGPRASDGAAPVRGGREQLRYDHDYTAPELEAWLAKVRAMATEAKQTYLFFNNCHAGQAARSAALMEELLQRQAHLL